MTNEIIASLLANMYTGIMIIYNQDLYPQIICLKYIKMGKRTMQ